MRQELVCCCCVQSVFCPFQLDDERHRRIWASSVSTCYLNKDSLHWDNSRQSPKTIAKMKTICDKIVTFLMSPRRWKKTSEQQQPQGEDHQLAKEDQEDCYPNCDISIWLRNCGSETIEPIKGISFGSIPDWISGCLYRNGPGKQRYDRQSVNHLFDASGLLHKSVATPKPN